jgi:hypothetical protein
MMTTNNIIPEQEQAVLLACRDGLISLSWLVGDTTNRIIDGHMEGRTGVTPHEVYGAVGRMVGKSYHSIASYAKTSKCFDVETRLKYNVLPFSHFVFASQRTTPIEVLELAAKNMDGYGMPPTLEELTALWNDRQAYYEDVPDIGGQTDNQYLHEDEQAARQSGEVSPDKAYLDAYAARLKLVDKVGETLYALKQSLASLETFDVSMGYVQPGEFYNIEKISGSMMGLIQPVLQNRQGLVSSKVLAYTE